MNKQHPAAQAASLTAIAAACLLTGCGGGSAATHPPANPAANAAINGVVSSVLLTAGSATTPTLNAGYYQGALVCYDPGNTGHCAAGQKPVATNAQGQFTLPAGSGPIIADIGTSATNTANGQKVASRLALRIAPDQVAEQSANGGKAVISPMSSEVLRAMEANSSQYQTEKANLAARIGVAAASVLADANTLSGATQYSVLTEENILAGRFAYATAKLDRGDKYPDALAAPGGDPELTGLANVTAATAATADTRQAITFQQAQQAAMNIEGIPRYDHIFIVMLENKGTQTILGSPYAPNINKYLQAGNQFTSYFATGNPSEPNYTALGGGDDWGITDDSQWNCGAAGASAVQDLPMPDSSQPGLQSSPFAASCAISGTQAVHNIVGKPNIFNALSGNGMQWRTYSESMNPGQDVRTDSVADPAVTANDNNTAGLVLPMPASLYKTKHHPGMAYQNVRSAPEFKFSNRTLGGGQWDANLVARASKYAVPANYNVDQFGSDLQSGAVGQINFIMPDQCDDMHGISVPGADGHTHASDCSGNALITRGDNFVNKLVQKIQASPLWANRQKRVAIVLMFDEGTATSGYNSCCGWNPSNGADSNPLKRNADGSWSADASILNYTQGNSGHGESVFAVLNNQPDAPKGIIDSDAYSHFSFVRTLQDMFGLADPGNDASYMNRTKYTEKFVAQNLLNLPEYAGSADTHFDSVRPMNHAYVIPATYVQKQSSDVTGPAQVGPDASKTNVWALK